MAKIKNLFFVIVLLFVASTAFSQIDTSKYKVVKSQVDGKVVGVENKVAIVGIDSGKAQAGLTYILNFPSLITSIYTDPDTSGIFRTTLDSIPITANSWFDVNAYTADSTIFLCFNRTFPLHSVIPIPAGSHNVRQYSISVASYGYLYKRTQTRKHSIEKNAY